MEKIGLFWGSNTGNQEEATNYLTDYMKGEGCEVDLFNIAETPPVKMLEYEKLIIGCPTWHIGELQDDWDAIYEDVRARTCLSNTFFGFPQSYLARFAISITSETAFTQLNRYILSVTHKKKQRHRPITFGDTASQSW